jgi:hypothetical protein
MFPSFSRFSRLSPEQIRRLLAHGFVDKNNKVDEKEINRWINKQTPVVKEFANRLKSRKATYRHVRRFMVDNPDFDPKQFPTLLALAFALTNEQVERSYKVKLARDYEMRGENEQARETGHACDSRLNDEQNAELYTLLQKYIFTHPYEFRIRPVQHPPPGVCLEDALFFYIAQDLNEPAIIDLTNRFMSRINRSYEYKINLIEDLGLSPAQTETLKKAIADNAKTSAKYENVLETNLRVQPGAMAQPLSGSGHQTPSAKKTWLQEGFARLKAPTLDPAANQAAVLAIQKSAASRTNQAAEADFLTTGRQTIPMSSGRGNLPPTQQRHANGEIRGHGTSQPQTLSAEQTPPPLPVPVQQAQVPDVLLPGTTVLSPANREYIQGVWDACAWKSNMRTIVGNLNQHHLEFIMSYAKKCDFAYDGSGSMEEFLNKDRLKYSFNDGTWKDHMGDDLYTIIFIMEAVRNGAFDEEAIGDAIHSAWTMNTTYGVANVVPVKDYDLEKRTHQFVEFNQLENEEEKKKDLRNYLLFVDLINEEQLNATYQKRSNIGIALEIHRIATEGITLTPSHGDWEFNVRTTGNGRVRVSSRSRAQPTRLDPSLRSFGSFIQRVDNAGSMRARVSEHGAQPQLAPPPPQPPQPQLAPPPPPPPPPPQPQPQPQPAPPPPPPLQTQSLVGDGAGVDAIQRFESSPHAGGAGRFLRKSKAMPKPKPKAQRKRTSMGPPSRRKSLAV